MRRLLLFAILALSISAGAQPDYQCVLPGRAQFFSNAKGYLRGMRIDSIRAIGGATVLYPFHTRRIRDRYKIDSNGGSWLGKEIRQFANGRTEFQNYWNDTVVIETVAKVGESWTFCRDTTSLSVTALVASIDTATIDGTLDSIKAIRLTALNNGIPDPSNQQLSDSPQQGSWIPGDI